ncbi:MAG: hypothetical protein ABSC92_18670 [Rhizomicrobium sp.]
MPGDAAKMAHHAFVQAGSVPIGRTEKIIAGKIVGQLNKAARGALNEIERGCRRVGLVLPGENPTGVELTKVEQLPELVGIADSATSDRLHPHRKSIPNGAPELSRGRKQPSAIMHVFSESRILMFGSLLQA